MIKSMLSCALIASCLSSATQAGDMGPVKSEVYTAVPFISAEGSYTWNQIDRTMLLQTSSQQQMHPWGGRVAGGYIRQFSPAMSFTSEGGLGYYGSTNRTLAARGYQSKASMSGLDLLIGFMYDYNQFGLFLKGGAMVQNKVTDHTINLGLATSGSLISGSETGKANTTELLPELKVGGVYNLTDNVGITLAYMHVFGSNVQGTYNISAAPGSIVMQSSGDFTNPTLDSVLLGIQYTWA